MGNIPRHIAIIMDGNGRWAQARGLSRVQGHQEGGKRVDDIIRAADKQGVKYLTLYAFSKENWQRPSAEVAFLMELLSSHLDTKFRELMENNVSFNTIGEIKDLPASIQKKIARNTEALKKNTGLVLTLALSYSSRVEITQAVRQIAEKVAQGKMKAEEVTEDAISNHLYTAGLPDPDLLIRTSGELRISNFLLWQISYAELYVTEKFWPDFTEEEFVKALDEYQRRERRFGRTSPVR